ncbi:putative transport protein [Paraburkholderia sp. WC7.3g]
MSWIAQTLRQYPEIAVFLSLGIGYWVGGKSYKGFGLGAVTATLLAAIAIGQFGITISANVKSVFFLMFLFAVGYGVGPQFVRGIAKDGLPQALFSVIQCVLCLVVPVAAAKIAGYDLGSAAGLFAGSQTISASMGLATDAINRLGLPPDETKTLLNAMPTAYAVTYIFGTIGSAVILGILGPILLRIDLVAACKEYEARLSGGKELGGAGQAWHKFELRAYRIAPGAPIVGMTVAAAEANAPDGARLFIQRIRRGGAILEATLDMELKADDIAAVGGRRELLVSLIAERAAEVDDPELLAVPVEGVDVYITSKEVEGKTLQELAHLPGARGVYLRKIRRGPTETQIPILPNTTLHRGDTITIVGRTQDTTAAAKTLGVLDRPTSVADIAFVSLAITLGALIGSIVIRAGTIPLTLSTSGGALIAGIGFGWYRAIHDVRPDSRANGLVHEFRRAQRVHWGHRYHGRPRVCQRLATAWRESFSMGHLEHNRSVDSWHGHREVPVQIRPGHSARHLRRRANDHRGARDDLRRREEPSSRSRVHRNLCSRQHTFDDMGHGRCDDSFLAAARRLSIDTLVEVFDVQVAQAA